MKYYVPLRKDRLFFSLGSAGLKPYACLLDSAASLQKALTDKHICIVGSSAHVREQLTFLFSEMESFTRGVTDTNITLDSEDEEELKNLLEHSAAGQGSYILFLAEDMYGQAFNQLCKLVPSCLPVLTPVGILLPAMPGGWWHNGALCAKHDSALQFLHGKEVVLWGKNPGCLEQIWRMTAPVYESITIAGVIHEKINDIAVGNTSYTTRRPDDVKDLRCDALITTQTVIDDENLFTKISNYTLVAMVHDIEYSIYLTPDNQFLFFYSSQADCRSQQSPIFEIAPVCMRNGYFVNNLSGNANGDYENGFRKTAYQPQNYDNRIHVLGPSFTVSPNTAVEETYCSVLQHFLSNNRTDTEKNYFVQNLGVGSALITSLFLCLHDTIIKEGDIVILHNRFYHKEVIKYIIAIQKLCANKGARFIVFDHADVGMLENPHEQDMMFLDSYCFAASSLFSDAMVNNSDKKKFLEHLKGTGIQVCDLSDCLDGVDQGIFTDPWHVQAQGNRLIAEYMYEKVINRHAFDLSDAYAESIWLLLGRIRNLTLSCEENTEWLAQIPRIQERESDLIGSIVMNCNPFTLGHKHIIAQSLERVDKLYIFVVQEDKSFFSFEERFAMVRDGTREFGSRVCVVPSGKLIISSATFPDYFCKEVVTYDPDTRTDILIFCSTVAPALGIKVRLFGEEPYCKVTEAYHKQCAELLPICGVLPIQIPRLEQGGAAISASGVRRILGEGKFSQLARLVPPTTMPYLIKKTLQETGKTEL